MTMYLTLGFLLALGDMQSAEINLLTAFKLFLAAIVMAAWYINGSALNDYSDYEIDRINLKGDKDRPIVSGQASRKEVLQAAMITGSVAIVLSALLSWRHLLAVVVLLILNVAYSVKPFQISRRGGLAPLILPVGYIVLPFSMGYFLLLPSIGDTLIILTAAYYSHFIGRIILKDYRDVKGDRQHGKLTFLLRRGNLAVCMVSGAAVTLGVVLTLYGLKSIIGDIKYPMVTLLCFGLTCLWQLSKTKSWKEQKPLLSAFGRSMTGITALTITSLVFAIWDFRFLSHASAGFLIMLVYLWSSFQAYSYNEMRLKNKYP